ncbi:hypothetical protein BGZ65_008591, partial [Modicella reniformis]
LHQLLITPPSQYFISLLGIVQLGNHGLTCLVVPYHPLGNLRRYIADQRVNLNPLQQLQIIHDIASGLELLHQRGAQHLNLHSANVLISLQGMAILTDIGRVNNRAEVGMAPKPTAELERIRSLAVVFLAPEVLASNSFSSRSEVYALGMIMFELLTGRVAFEKDLGQPGLSTRVMFGRQEQMPEASQLEQIMLVCRQRAEALMLEQKALQLRQHQQAQYEQPHESNSIGTHTPPLQKKSAIDPTRSPSSSRRVASAAALTSTSTAATNTVTTHVIVSEQNRLRTELSKTTPQGQEEETDKKPIEAWTIGSATTSSSVVRQRDALPITTRALEIASGHLGTKSSTPDQSPASTFSAASILLPNVSPIVVALLPVSSPSPIQQYSRTHTPSPTMVAGSVSNITMINHSWPAPPTTTPSWPMPPTTTPSWPMPPTKVYPPQPIANSSKPTANIPRQPPAVTEVPVTASSFPMPPPLRSNNDHDSTPKAYGASPAIPSPIAASISSATTSRTSTSSSSDTTPSPIPTPAGIPSSHSSSSSSSSSSAAAVVPILPLNTTTSVSIAPPPSSPGFMSPGSLFNIGRSTIIVTNFEEQFQQESMPTFFNWQQIPMIPKSEDEIQRKISSVASSVKVVENGCSGSDTDLSAKGQENRLDKVKSLVATIEPGMFDSIGTPVPPMPLAYKTESVQPQPPAAGQPQGPARKLTPNLGVAPRKPPPPPPPQPQASTINSQRESVLIIPAFPEPPKKMHNRRISNMDARFRIVTRPMSKTQLYTQERAGSQSSEDSFAHRGPKSPTRGIYNSVMAPQESSSGTPTTTGLIARGTYTPIASSDDVPTGTPSDCIYSAARNGDLVDLQDFLNQAITRALSSDSSSTSSLWIGQNPKSPANPRFLSPVAEILDEFEPIERLPVLCCAAVARKNKYQALNMVLKAGANVEGKEHRAGNTPLHLICETAPPPIMEPTVMRYKQDKNGSRIEAEGVVELNSPRNSQSSLMDAVAKITQDNLYDEDADDDETEEALAAALKKVDEQDEQEEAALERVKVDSESTYDVTFDDEGYQTLSSRYAFETLNQSYYQIHTYILMRGGLEDQIRLMALAGSPIDTPNFRGETPLLLLLRFHDSVTAIATLLSLGADPTLMAPFGPGTNPPEIHVDPMSMLTPKDQKRVSKTMRSNQQSLVSKQTQQPPFSNDPNHILVLHGGALAQAAYYLRIECLKYLLENEIECSDPSVIDQAIVACKQSVSAQVNPSLVAAQKRVLRILEHDWKGERGRRRRAYVAERILNRQRKPPRINVLLIALSVASSVSSTSLPSSSSSVSEHSACLTFPIPPTTTPPVSSSGSGRPSNGQTKSPQGMLGSIPTTHFYTSTGPRGPEIELISQHGFEVDSAGQRFQVADRPTDTGASVGVRIPPGDDACTEGSLTREIHGWRISADSKSPNLIQNAGPDPNNKGLLKKFRNMGKRP